MMVHDWTAAPGEQLTPLLSRQVIHCTTLTIARLHLQKGAVVPMHHHVNEQVTTIERGRLRFQIGGQEIELAAGQSLVIPPDLPHSVEALEDSTALDVFSPAREDWQRGDDAYLRSAASK
jgi:quercetin dioxygenase-like cupin family protein